MDIGGSKDTSERKFLLAEDLEVKEPFHLFDKWFKIVNNDPRTDKANAMCLSTVSKDGDPSARFVLMKGYSKEGFVFFTHYTSRKGQQMEESPKVALTFYWEYYSRSVRVEGTAEKLPFSAADSYFSTRPYESQIGSSASDQREDFLVKPSSIEFWQGQTDRLHDRIRFRKPKANEPDGYLTHQAEDGWIYERLSP
ncbi:hypothetical protein NQ317_000853 [Molorchus minor]|uniref:pyridoxal 5'-phosphate synthase n=1 Tax=Molorchus minor TaxID=1323400 RepID=A0ABQ9JTH5_9CUCU|nr:hypothetical protein NQ317_000853 [Molorchus minor]